MGVPDRCTSPLVADDGVPGRQSHSLCHDRKELIELLDTHGDESAAKLIGLLGLGKAAHLVADVVAGAATSPAASLATCLQMGHTGRATGSADG